MDSSTEGFALEATGDPEKLDEFIDVMRSYGEIEVTRSGMVAVSLEAKKLRAVRRPLPKATAGSESIRKTDNEQPNNEEPKQMAKRYYEQDGNLQPC